MAASTPPFEYAVLAMSDAADGAWTVIHENGSRRDMLEWAEQWAQVNPGQTAIVVDYHNHCVVEPRAQWART